MANIQGGQFRFSLRALFAMLTVTSVIVGYPAGQWLAATILAVFTLAVIEGPLSRDYA
jgi:uncharacterized integral membrane protein